MFMLQNKFNGSSHGYLIYLHRCYDVMMLCFCDFDYGNQLSDFGSDSTSRPRLHQTSLITPIMYGR